MSHFDLFDPSDPEERAGFAFLRKAAIRSILAGPGSRPIIASVTTKGRGHSRALSADQPSIAAIKLALPPAAVVSMQVTRSVANRAT